MRKNKRQFQRKRRVHDLRPLYGELPGNRRIVAMSIDEPGGLLSTDGAVLERAAHNDGSTAEGQPEWVAPVRPQIIVAQSIRSDPLGQMYARRQVRRAEYLAGRAYQELHAIAEVGNVSAIDPMRSSSRGGNGYDPLNDRQRRASGRLRSVNGVLAREYGGEGVFVIRAVLIYKATVRDIVNAGPASHETARKYYGSLLGRCLNLISVQLGYATRSAQDVVSAT